MGKRNQQMQGGLKPEVDAAVGTTFTAQQLEDWKAFERVRASGKHNMFFPAAQRAAHLDDDRYLFVLKHYSEMKAQVGLVKDA